MNVNFRQTHLLFSKLIILEQLAWILVITPDFPRLPWLKPIEGVPVVMH